jgi:hypothetical protein
MPQVYHIAAANVSRAWLYVPIVIAIVLLSLVIVLIGASFRAARHSTFELSAEGLRLRGDLYGRFIPMAQLDAKDAELVDVRSGPLRPARRTAGTAVPGFRSGWFRLADGSKALLYVTDPTRVVRIPTSEGYTVLLSVAESDAFVDQLHSLAGK